MRRSVLVEGKPSRPLGPQIRRERIYVTNFNDAGTASLYVSVAEAAGVPT
jgi:hypothetical protein